MTFPILSIRVSTSKKPIYTRVYCSVYGMFINTGDIRKPTTVRLYQAHGEVKFEEYIYIFFE
jgi:hypothetical protein